MKQATRHIYKIYPRGETLPRGKLNNGSPPGTTKAPIPSPHQSQLQNVCHSQKKLCSICPPSTGTLFTSVLGSQKLYTE
jgi:hypothetical protein